ncbi:ABC transporter ATP-binding protein [Tabrizicola aquatica]|uniref:ABC transporter ATP-binding protein n=1 Tax=Tabrizicola aquatica TaxID=909926 RepID=UPI000CD3062D|nr:ABC transporter ATP-binding protein [Tabrizicola aquatica]
MSVLEVRDLTVSFRQDGRVIQAVKGVSFSVSKGETVALVGESGSGKSVTALSTVGLLGDNAQVTGSVTYRGTQMVGADERALRKVRGNDISFIFQEPMTSLNPLHTIEKQLAESLALHQGLTGDKARARIIELMQKVGIRDAESRLGAYPHQLSGGQRQRVMIAMALANGPELLVADEPTTALDVTIQAQILDLLADLKKAEGLSLLFITHDLGIVRRIADRVCVMQGGEIVEQGPTAEIFANPRHPYTQKLLAAEQKGGPDPVPEGAPEIVRTESLRVWFPIQQGLLRRTVGHVKAVNDATLTVRAGETLGIVGESGSGKTTLALAILRLLDSQGKVVFLGRDISRLDQAEASPDVQQWGELAAAARDALIGARGRKAMRVIRRNMQVVFQDPYGSLSPRMTVEQIIAEGLGVHGVEPGRNRTEMVAEIMAEVGLDPATMGRYPHEFSGGQRQRIAIARAMILRPLVVVLDEPTSALDMTVQVQIVQLLRELQRKWGLAYIFISHDLRVIRAMAHKVMVMRAGDIVETGDCETVFTNPSSDYTKALMAAAFGPGM